MTKEVIRHIDMQRLHDCEHYNRNFSEWLNQFAAIAEKYNRSASEIISELRKYADVLEQEAAVYSAKKITQ